jgi:hypothetical protein
MVENVIGFMDLDESLINEFNTTLELGNLCTNNSSFLESWQNWISWGEAILMQDVMKIASSTTTNHDLLEGPT